MPTAPTEPRRRLVACDSFDRVLDDLATLRRGYVKVGTWTPAQVCRHLSVAMEGAAHPVVTTQTPDQAALWEQFKAMVSSSAGMTPGRPIPNPAAVPPADCGDAEYDRFAAAVRLIADHPGPTVNFGRFGPVPIDEARWFHLAHANHHLSFLRPATAGRSGLAYPDVAAALADVAALRRGYVRTGNWNLAQIAFHLSASLRNRMSSPADAPADTPEQIARRPMLERVLATNEVASGLTAPPPAAPPPDLTDDSDAGRAAIDDLVAQLTRLATYDGPFAPHRLFGRMTAEQNVRHQLVHAAHHLGHLVPA